MAALAIIKNAGFVCDRCMQHSRFGKRGTRTISIRATQLVEPANSDDLQTQKKEFFRREDERSSPRKYNNPLDSSPGSYSKLDALPRSTSTRDESPSQTVLKYVASDRQAIQQQLQKGIATENGLARYFTQLLLESRYQEILSDWKTWKTSLKTATRSARLLGVRNCVFVAFMCSEVQNIAEAQVIANVIACFVPYRAPKKTEALSQLIERLDLSPAVSQDIESMALSIEEATLSPNTNSFLAGIDNLFSKHRSDEAWGLYQKAKVHPTPIESESYQKFILGFLGIKRFRYAQIVLEDMRAAGYTPSSSVWAALVSHQGDKKDLTGLQRMWHDMSQKRVVIDTVLSTTLIDAYFKCSSPDLALAVLQDMIKDKSRFPNTITCNVVVKGLVRHQGSKVALDFLSDATESGMNPDSTTYNLLLKACLDAGDMANVKSINAKMKQAGLRDVSSYTILIDHLMKKDMPTDELQRRAHTIIDQMKQAGIKANAHIYSTIIKHTLQSNHKDDIVPTPDQILAAEAWLSHMKDNNVPRSVVLYELLLRAHVTCSIDVRSLFRVWEDMRRDRIAPDSGAYNIMIKGLVRFGLLPEAYQMFEKALVSGVQPRPNTYSYLLNAAAAHEKVEIGQLVVNHIVRSGFRVSTDGLRRAVARVESIGCDVTGVVY